MKRILLSSSCAIALGLAAISVASAAEGQVTLRLLPNHLDAHVENYNPYNYGVPAGMVQDFSYEPLWIYNVRHPENDFPALATSYESSDDLMSFTYHLRQGVKWSDGEDFNADDVIFTYNYNKDHPDFPIGFDFYDATTDTGSIDSIEKIDDHTVRFNLHAPNSLAHSTIGIVYPLPEHIWKDVEDPKNYANKDLVATGPWTDVRNFSRNSLEICRNELYRDNGDNQIDCLQFPQVSGNEQVIAAITVGDLDWSGDGMTDPEITFAPKSEFNHFWLPADGDTNLQLNTTRAPFDNLEFRKALSMAIDRQTILDISTFGLTTKTNYPVGTGEFYASWFNRAELAQYEYLMEYNPDAAAAVLDAAGIVDQDGDGWRDNADGSAIEFNISVPAGWTDWVNTVQTISENLHDIGVRGNMHAAEEGAWFDTIPTGEFDVFIMWTETYANPWGSYKGMFTPASMVPGQIREQAMHQMRIPEIESLLEEVAASSDLETQKAAIQKVHVLVAENLPVISLFANPSWYQYSTRRFTGWVTEDNDYVRPMMHTGIHERVKHALALVPVEGAQ